MENVLTPTPFHVEDQLVSRLGDAHLFGDLFGPEEQFGNLRSIRLCKVVNTADMSSRNQEDMNRCMGVQVLEGHD